MVTDAIDQFRRNRDSIKDLDQIFDLIAKKFPLLLVQAEEILRAEIAMIVSALDNYIHDCVRLGMIEIFQGTRLKSKHYSKFNITIDYLENIISSASASRLNILEDAIKRSNATDSFQSPKNIEYALNLISLDKLWTRLSPAMGISAEDIKSQLGLIVERRNKIVHESDFNNTTGSKYPVDKAQTSHAVNFISTFCESIYGVL